MKTIEQGCNESTRDKLLRRQLLMGIALLLLAVFTASQAVYFSLEDRSTQRCINDKFHELSRALDVRSTLTERETEAASAIWDVYGEAAGLVKDDPTEPLAQEDQDRLNTKLVKTLLSYQEEIALIEEKRAKNPLPPYTIGTCG